MTDTLGSNLTKSITNTVAYYLWTYHFLYGHYGSCHGAGSFTRWRRWRRKNSSLDILL